ncbi:MAG: cell division protein FtsQ/DivIB [Oceanicaulis sp.]
MSKVGRAGVRDSTKGAGSRRKAKPKTTKSPSRLGNWAAAQWRAARHRAGYAIKLVSLAGLVLGGLTLGVLALLGRLDDTGAAVLAFSSEKLAETGHTVAWLDVAGAERLTHEEIAALIGAAPGTGLADIDLAAARETLQAQSWVKSADVLRLWPDRLAVLITERRPRALWQLEEVYRVIDADGVVIDGADPADHLDLPRVVGAGANTGADEILSLVALHPEIAARTRFAIKVGERRWSLRLENNGEILLPADDPASALATLSALHAERGVLDYDAQIIDLRNTGEMVMRPWPDRAAEAAGRGA